MACNSSKRDIETILSALEEYHSCAGSSAQAICLVTQALYWMLD